MGLPLHSKIRQHLKNSLSAFLSVIFPSKALHDALIPTDTIQRILVIRINYRIGNILFTTPFLRALEMRFPDAEIDMLIGASYPAPLLTGFKTIHKIIDVPRGLLKRPIHLYRFIRQMRQVQYDAVICLNAGSGSDRLAANLMRSRYKLSFDNLKNYSPFSHVITPPEGVIHEALKPLYLMRAFGNQPEQFPQHMDIALSEAERQQGYDELKSRLMAQGLVEAQGRALIGLFRDARFEKKIENAWWQAWYLQLKQLLPNAVFIDILSPDVPVKLADEMYVLSESNLRQLGTMLSHLSVFVCADTGPMHLASASKTPTIALFKASAPKLYGTLGAQDRSLDISGLSPQEVATQVAQHVLFISQTQS